MTNDYVHERVMHAVLERQAAKYGDRVFLYFKDQEYGYAEFNHAANRVACGLQRLGIVKGDKVAIMMGNCPEFLFLLFGISKAGAIQVAVNTAHKGDLLRYFLEHSDARVLVVESQYLDRIEPIVCGGSKIEALVVLPAMEKGPGKLDKPVTDFSSLIGNDGKYQPVEVLWSDPFGIMYTSGTTGPSKGALMPHNYTLHMAEFCIKAIEYDETDCLYNALPLFHGNAQLLSFMPALMSGARTVLAERFSASAFWGDIKHYGCTEFNSIGGIASILYKADPKPDDAANPLRKIFAAATPKEIFRSFEKRFGVKIIEGYGMNEIGIPVVNSMSERRPGCCGKILPEYNVRIVKDDGAEAGAGEAGEILVRPLKPYAMMLEYYKMPERTAEAWRDLWFHTGDCGYRNEEGYYYFVDRKKDALRRRGENISSYEVETVVNSHATVLESAAIAAKSELGEDEVMICVILKPGHSLTPQELIAYCEDRMAYFMVPRYVRIMNQLPKTPTEKVKKTELRNEGVTSDTWDRERHNPRQSRTDR